MKTREESTVSNYLLTTVNEILIANRVINASTTLILIIILTCYNAIL